MKPRAMITLYPGSILAVGLPAIGKIEAHPRQGSFTEEWQMTSAVVKINSNGSFETLNTRYEVVS